MLYLGMYLEPLEFEEFDRFSVQKDTWREYTNALWSESPWPQPWNLAATARYWRDKDPVRVVRRWVYTKAVMP